MIHIIRIGFYLTCILPLLMSPALAQEKELAFRHLSISDGLSQSSVISITQDQKGLLWFGTRDGLNKYDGHEFTVYKHQQQDSLSISNNDILEVVTDSQGDLWIGTFNGLNRYDYRGDRFISYYNQKGDSTTLSDNSIWAICEASNGDIWVGTAQGLNRFNKRTGSFERFYHEPKNTASLSHNYVLDLFEDKDGFLWVATARGLNRINISTKGEVSFTRYLHQEGNPHSLSDNHLQSIAADQKGNLWIGTKNGGLNYFDKRSGRFRTYRHQSGVPHSISSNDIRSLVYDQQGRLWVGTYAGLNLMDPEKGTFRRLTSQKDNPHSLRKNSVKSIFLDAHGSLWVGTYYGGVSMLDPQNSNFKNYKYTSSPTGLSFDVVSALVEGAEGKIFIGTEGGGVNVLDRQSDKITHLQWGDGSKQNIKSLYLKGKKELWVGTFNAGLHLLDLEKGTVEVYQAKREDPFTISDNNVYAITPLNDSLYWIGTHGGGLNLFNKKNGQFQAIQENAETQLSSNFIRNLEVDAKGNLWVGTQYGLNFLSAENIRKRNFTFQRYFFDETRQTGEDVLTIFEDSRSRIWVGTNETGLHLFDPETRKFVPLKLSAWPQLSSEVVHGIREDGHHNLWISSNQGLLCFNPSDSSIRLFDESNGLISNEFNNGSCLRTKDGQMYFGSFKGLTRFHPDSLSMNRYTPPVVLTDFKLSGQSAQAGRGGQVLVHNIADTRELSLEYDQAIFSIEFAMPNYINPVKNQYAYRLKGLEEEWNISKSNQATYTIQKPGTYTFEVKGANSDGFWNPQPTILTIHVNPAPWRTWWAFLCYGLVIIVALYLLVQVLLSRYQLKHELELEHMSRERQNSLNQMKLQFFTNVSHEFRTPLTLILGPLEEMISNYRGSNSLYKQLVPIQKNANRMLRLIDQLMDFRKYENNHLQLKAAEGNIVDFVKEVYLSFTQYAGLHQFAYTFHCEQEEIRVWYDRDKMERVIFNLISNAFKYTPDGGSIQVVVQQLNGKVEIAVKDSGVGMAPEHMERIFERFYEVGQYESAFTTKYKRGTGIGLALAKGIMDLHAGEIKVESTLHQGSTFRVQLLQGSQHLREDQMMKQFKGSDDVSQYEISDYLPENAEVDGPVDPKKGASKILVVEDNEDVRHYLKSIFCREYHVVEAANGKEGLEKVEEEEPDLVLSDVMMPEMDGITFCSRMKQAIQTSHIPFILLTARTSLLFKHEGLETGADDYINKPFNVKELQIKVRNLISSRRILKEKFSSESVIRPSDIAVTSLDEELLEKALQIVEDNISNELFDVATFSEELGVSRTMLFTKIKAWTNLTPNEFLRVMRMKRAAQLLAQNKLTVAQVGYKVGFKNPKYFSKCFQRHFNETPTAYAKRCAAGKEELFGSDPLMNNEEKLGF